MKVLELPPQVPPALQQPPVWIFGYGSLVWRPDFEFSARKVGFIRGYSRRFWQGDTFHRGSEKTPGRVATLLEDHEACTWGVAYQVCGEQITASLQYLNMREAVLGGYDTKLVKFYPLEKDADEPILALVYIATPQNPSYLGPASEEDIAAQIIVSSGRTGHNIEYLLQLANFMRYFCPQVEDEHLFSIEEALISILPCLCHKEESLEEGGWTSVKSQGTEIGGALEMANRPEGQKNKDKLSNSNETLNWGGGGREGQS